MENNCVKFRQAVPVWMKGRETELNCSAALTCALPNGLGETTLRITGASFYQVFCDDALIHFGPARKAHGFSAVDLLSLPAGTIQLTICVAGYYCPCFNGVLQSSFIQAEVEWDGEVIAATGGTGFRCYKESRRLQRVTRFSRQRQFCESWDYTREPEETEFTVTSPNVTLVDRGVPYADYTEFFAKPMPMAGRWKLAPEPQIPKRYFVDPERKDVVQFPLETLESQAYDQFRRSVCDYCRTSEPVGRMEAGQCRLWDFGEVQTGFFRLKIKTWGKTRVLFAFDEQLDQRNRPFAEEFSLINLIEWILPEGEWELYSFEPYVARYAELLVMEGAAELTNLSIQEFACPADKIRAQAPKDPELALIHRAAERTFRHNVLDIYMDCPSRERAGWLFDSFYTGKAEWFFTGDSVVERAFLRNYAAGGGLKERPGMVSMIYPGDTGDHFIPQWSMWYALEIYDYVTQRGGQADRELFREQIRRLFQYFDQYENEYGLLEQMPGLNFVEWSAVNDRVQDVSWATNMLYAHTLCRMGELFAVPVWQEKGEQLKQTIRDMAFDGFLFRDRAMRTEDGKIANTQELSEVTQYYALRFDTVDIDDSAYGELRRMVLEVFGPQRQEEYPEIVKADLLPGVYLRMELLLRYGLRDKLLEEIKEYFLPMAKETGTLWEHCSGYKSRDHCFASFAAVAISEALKKSEK